MNAVYFSVILPKYLAIYIFHLVLNLLGLKKFVFNLLAVIFKSDLNRLYFFTTVDLCNKVYFPHAVLVTSGVYV